MSRTMLRAGDFGRLVMVVALTACGGSSELGLFESGASGAGGSPIDASGDRGASGAGGAAGDAVTKDAPSQDTPSQDAPSQDAAPLDARADRRVAEDAGIDAPRPDAQVVDTGPPTDASRVHDAAPDAIVVDACRPTNGGVERCDGIDNDCNGRIDDRTACPTGCIGATHGGHGYMLCHTPMARRPWQAAESACSAAGMHLVRVDDAAENAFIRATADGVNDSSAVWIGGSDIMTERRWVWTDSTAFWMGGPLGMPLDGRYSNWDVGQPDDGNRNVDCAAMREGGETWRDANCALRRAYFCEE